MWKQLILITYETINLIMGSLKTQNPTIIVNSLFLMADSEQNFLRLLFLQLIKKKNHFLVKDAWAHTNRCNGATALSLDPTARKTI